MLKIRYANCVLTILACIAPLGTAGAQGRRGGGAGARRLLQSNRKMEFPSPNRW